MASKWRQRIGDKRSIGSANNGEERKAAVTRIGKSVAQRGGKRQGNIT